MLGLEGVSVFAAWMSLVAVTLLCIVYGIVRWNSEGDVSRVEQEEEKKWLKEEIEIDDELSGGLK